MYMLCTLWAAAMRSVISPWAWQRVHQVRRSLSDGCCLPFSSLETLVKCQPVRAASWRPDRPASLRISRSRPPRASRACSSCLGKARAGLDDGVAGVRDRDGPDCLECRLAEPDGIGVDGQL